MNFFTGQSFDLINAQRNPYPTRKGFGLRVANAAKSIRKLGIDCDADIYTRGFDSCFENFDGDAVVWALMDKAVNGDINLEIGIKRMSNNDRLWHSWMKVYKNIT